MKRAVLYVFSGTGNTILVAGLYRKYLSGAGYETLVHQVKMNHGFYADYPDPNDFELVGFAYPVHGFNCPEVMNNFCRQLPSVGKANGKGKRSFIFKTSGEGLGLNNYSSQKIISVLRRKGFDIMMERHYVMPYNMIFRHSPEMVKSEYIYADAYVRSNVKEISLDIHERISYFPLRYWFVPLVRIEWLYARLQGPAMKVDERKCVKCMKCVSSCPLGNIRYEDGRFRFGTNCALCVCCSFGCPSEAISIGLLNGWRVNGSYSILRTASDPGVRFPAFGEDLRGIRRWLYYRYYRRLDSKLHGMGIELNLDMGSD